MGLVYTRKADGTLEQAKMLHVVTQGAGLDTEIKEFDQMNDRVVAYLTAADAAYTDNNGDSVSVMKTYQPTEEGHAYDRPLGYPLVATSGNLYLQRENSGDGWKLSVSDGDIRNAIYNAVPGEVSQYLVKDADGNLLEAKRIKPTGKVRMLRFYGYVRNCRDLGGWSCDGGTVKYGKLFRSAVVASGETWIDPNIAKNIGIRHQVDFRGDAEANYITESTLGSEVRYHRFPLEQYYADSVNPSSIDYPVLKNVFRTIIEAAVHDEGLLFNCSLGRDRTGTVTFLLLALLGVAKKDIDKDYELSSFSGTIPLQYAYRTGTNYMALVSYLSSFGGKTLRDNAVWWFVRAGFSVEELNAFRAAMIDGTPDTLSAENFQTYTNQLPISTDTDGSVFNGIGYKLGYRIDSSGGLAESEPTYTTGFIPCSSGDVIRFKNYPVNSTNNSVKNLRIGFYDANKSKVITPYWSAIIADENTVIDENNDVQSIVVSTYDTPVAFVRFSNFNTYSNSVITVNEEI